MEDSILKVTFLSSWSLEGDFTEKENKEEQGIRNKNKEAHSFYFYGNWGVESNLTASCWNTFYLTSWWPHLHKGSMFLKKYFPMYLFFLFNQLFISEMGFWLRSMLDMIILEELWNRSNWPVETISSQK